MPDIIVNGTGSGCFPAEVGPDNRLHVRAISESLQHATAHENQNAYQYQQKLHGGEPGERVSRMMPPKMPAIFIKQVRFSIDRAQSNYAH